MQADKNNTRDMLVRNNHNTGHYTPKNPEKYKGDITKIVFRSSWELHMNKFLDGNPNVLEWSSEPFGIPYVKPTTGKIHKYYPDYWVKFIDQHGNEHHELIEVKPDAQTRPPKHSKRKAKKTQLHENLAWAINEAKWKAAAIFCKEHQLKFRILSEKQIFR